MTAFLGLRQNGLPARLEPYRYEPLSQAREIRLIKILPSKRKTDDIFGVFIHTVLPEDGASSLIPSAPYEALSYSWGYPALTETIFVKGEGTANGPNSAWCTLKVTRELYAACLQLRRDQDKRTVWIDAICINQADLREKGGQILLMRPIYSRAKHVSIWLGGERDTPPGAIASCLASCEQLCRLVKAESAARPHDEPSDRIISAVTLFSRVSDTSPAQRWADITKLFLRPWFRRTWVIQEAVLARDIIFMWGDQTIGWESLSTVAQALKIAYFYMLIPIEGIVDNIHSLIVVDAYKRGAEPDRAQFPDDTVRAVAHLSMLLIGTRSFLTSKGHDKIYGVLGLIPDDRLSSIVGMDYEQSVEHHYWRTALMIIGMGFYGAIATVWWESDPSESELPSWVTDFRQSKAPRDALSKLKAYRATKSSKAVLRFSEDHRKLLIRGKIIDTVSVIGSEFLPTPDGGNGEFEAERIITNSHLRMVKSLADCFNIFYRQIVCPDPDTDVDLSREDEELLARVLTCDVHVGGERPTKVEQPIVLREFQAFKAYHGTGLRAPWFSVKAPDPEFTRTFFDAGYFAGRVQTWVKGRAFFTSEKRRAGWAPPCAKPGDVVCLLLGFSVPFILRPARGRTADQDGGGAEQQYYLLGECYLHGVMEGEAMEDKELPNIEFTIV